MRKELYIVVNSLFDDSSFGFGEYKTESYNTGHAKYCKGCNLPVSMEEWLPPYEIDVSKNILGDFIFGTYIGFVVSENFRLQYEQTDLIGLTQFKPVDLHYKREKYSGSYYYPDISLVNAFVNEDYIAFEGGVPCDICQKGSRIINQIYGVKFITGVEIKEDIFYTTALGQGQVFVSERFKEFIEAAGFKNIKLLKASQYKWDCLNPIEYV